MTSIRISDALKHVFENSTDAVFGKVKSVTDRLNSVTPQSGGRDRLEPVSLGVLHAWITLFSILPEKARGEMAYSSRSRLARGVYDKISACRQYLRYSVMSPCVTYLLGHETDLILF